MDSLLQKLLPVMPTGSTVADAQRMLKVIGEAVLADLAGTAELADELEVPKQSIGNWAAGRTRKGFPKPMVRLKATPLYSRSEVLRWYELEGRP